MKKIWTGASALLVGASAGAIFAGAAQAETYSGVDAVAIEDFTGRITVEIGGGAVEASIRQGAKNFPVDFDQTSATLTIAGPPRNRKFKAYKEINWNRYGENAFARYLEDYPVMTLTIPAGSSLTLDDAVTIASIGDLEGDIFIERGYVEAEIGDVENADIDVIGPGDVSVGHVRDTLNAGVGGSGDFEALSARTAALSVGGSGDVLVGSIRGATKINVGGSGDVEVGDVSGPLDASVAGSGDVSVGAVAEGAQFSVAGSGDIEVESVNGPTAARISGSGGIEIDGGVAEDLSVSINGSGDFVHDGAATNLEARINGSGLVSVASNEGALTTSRRGEVRVGGRVVNKRND